MSSKCYSFAPKNDKKLAPDEPSCTVEPRDKTLTSIRSHLKIMKKLHMLNRVEPLCELTPAWKGTRCSVGLTSSKWHDLFREKKGLVGKVLSKQVRIFSELLTGAAESAKCRPYSRAKADPNGSEKGRGKKSQTAAVRQAPKKSEPTTGMRDASESLVLMSKLHTPKSVGLGFRKGRCLKMYSKIGRILRVCTKGGTPQTQRGGRDGGAVINRDSTSQFLKGWKKTLPRRSQSPKRARAQETLGSDARFQSWLQPVFGGPDAKV
ncbi:hypothetical protein B0H14DRAFT_2640096 [Mycena olivaceomarginata]|nr:hypothetical protein B0H14DRAFT_2640096 [Mycena olivaceomarginata]